MTQGSSFSDPFEVHLDPSERQISAISTPDDVTGEDRRNVLTGLDEIPVVAPIGLIDASTDASTSQSQVVIDAHFDVPLDAFVVSAQRLVDGTALFHYGIVTEVSGRVEGAETATDTARVASATLPGERFRRADVSWIRTVPEQYLPASSGAAVWVAHGIHRERALFMDTMDAHEAIPLGLDMNDEVLFMPYSFLNGERGAHVSISGKSGVATKTSYALFLLYMLFETEYGRQARRANSSDRAVLFSVKGADLCLLDKPNTVLFGGSEQAARARSQWTKLGVDDPQPFQQVGVYAPAEDTGSGYTPVPEISVRPKREAFAYGWSPMSFVQNGLLEFVFDDLDSGQISFIEQAVRIQLLRWAYPLAGDGEGRVVFVDPDATVTGGSGARVGHSWDSAMRALRSKQPVSKDRGTVVEDFDQLVEFITGKVMDENSPTYDQRWVSQVSVSTRQAFARRLWKAVPRLRRLIRAGLSEVDFARQLSVVDVHALHADAQRFVVAAVLARVWSDHEGSTAAGTTFVVLDELNKYAPRQSGSPIKSLLVDIAARGRSLGVILIGAQQNPSGVDRDITNNAALEVLGQIKSGESQELGFLGPSMRSRAQIIAPGTMITSQPLLPAPIPIRFPFPPYATRVSEVTPTNDARMSALLEDM